MGRVGEGSRSCGDIQATQRFGVSDTLLAKSIGQVTRSKCISNGNRFEKNLLLGLRTPHLFPALT